MYLGRVLAPDDPRRLPSSKSNKNIPQGIVKNILGIFVRIPLESTLVLTDVTFSSSDSSIVLGRTCNFTENYLSANDPLLPLIDSGIKNDLKNYQAGCIFLEKNIPSLPNPMSGVLKFSIGLKDGHEI